ncbi:MAG: hypothetical protein KAT00_01510 [Planctomycetes bacterium]|nr:hypothetical protein [Planctomycetota bacterium]
MTIKTISLLDNTLPNQKFKFPDNWAAMCSFCKLMAAGSFANRNGWVVSLFPGRKMKTSRMQVYIHPEDIVLPYAQAVPSRLVRRYWIFSLEQIILKCSCGNKKKHPIEQGYFQFWW